MGSGIEVVWIQVGVKKMTYGRGNSLRRVLTRTYPWIIAVILLGLALQRVPLEDVAQTLAQLTVGQILLIILINSGIVLLFSGRWWIILRALGFKLRYLVLSAYRLAGFAVSYFTPGPQFGGEPLQVYLLLKRENVPGELAAAAVTLDKALELLGNFTFLAIGGVVIIRFGLFSEWSGMLLRLIAFGLLLLPVAFILAAWRGKRPATWVVNRVPSFLGTRIQGFSRATHFVTTMEDEVIVFCQQQVKALFGAAFVSLFTWLVLVGEYWLMLYFLGVQLDIIQIIAVITIARFAFLTPLPAGLGVLEASQMLVLSSMGYNSAVGLSLALLIRARDLLFGGFGLLLGSHLLGRRTIPIAPEPKRKTPANH